MGVLKLQELAAKRYPTANLGAAGLSEAHSLQNVDKGGDFAAGEQPEIFVAEVCDSFKSLR